MHMKEYWSVVFHWLRTMKEAKNFFLTHGWESGYRCAEGFSSLLAYVRFQYLFCHLPLPDMPHLPTREVLVECAKWRRNYSLAIVIDRLCGLAYHGAQWCERPILCLDIMQCLGNICYFASVPSFLTASTRL